MSKKSQKSNTETVEVMEVPKTETPKLQGILARAEIDMQIATAKQFPRNIDVFRKELMDEAVALETASLSDDKAACYYSLPRAGKFIEGANIRLAEIAFRRFKNLMAQAEVSHTDDKRVYAVGMARDLENNTAVRLVVWRKITDKNGRRFDNDMIFVTGNAAASVAFREAVAKVIGRSYLDPVWQRCKAIRISGTKIKDVNKTAQAALDYLQKLGADSKDVLVSLGRKSIHDIDAHDIATMKGYAAAIKEGEYTIEELFGKIDVQSKSEAENETEAQEIKKPAKKTTKKTTASSKSKSKTNLF